MEASLLFYGTRAEWREIESKTVYMRPKNNGSDEWKIADIGRFPKGWRLNLPRRWRPHAYAYCTPKPN